MFFNMYFYPKHLRNYDKPIILKLGPTRWDDQGPDRPGAKIRSCLRKTRESQNWGDPNDPTC